MTRCVLVRHGQTGWNKEKRLQGQADIPLNAEGIAQAQALGQRLRGQTFDAVYCSDLSRAIDTAKGIVGNQPLQIDPRLRELGLGRFEGLVYEDARKLYPQELAAWEEDRENAPPLGEKLSSLTERANHFWEEMRLHYAKTDQNILIVSHGGTLRLMMCLICDLPPQRHWLFHFDNASLSEFVLYEGGVTLTLLNETSYLP